MNDNTSSGLQRSMGLFTAICMMTGCIVGASVFIVPGELTASVGPAAWVSYLIGAVLMFFNCFTFAQVGAILPVSGANYVLCSKAVNGTWGFMYVWGFLLSNSFLFPIMSRTMANYLAVFFPFVGDHITAFALIIFLITICINLLGMKVSTMIQNICVVLLIVVIVIFSLTGVTHADWSNFHPLFPGGVMPVIMGAISTYYAFAGVNCIIEMSGDIKNPRRNIPLTVFISFGIVVVIYIGMCIGLIALMHPDDLVGVARPAVTASETVMPGWFSYFIALAAIAASWTTLNGISAGMSRLIYVLGDVSFLPKFFSKLNKRNVPWAAFILLGVWGTLYILFNATIMQYVNISSFYLLFIALLIAVGSLRIKERFAENYENSIYKLKGIWYYLWPVLAIVSGIFFMILQLRDDPLMTGLSVILLPIMIGIYFLRKNALKKHGIDLDEEIGKRF